MPGMISGLSWTSSFHGSPFWLGLSFAVVPSLSHHCMLSGGSGAGFRVTSFSAQVSEPKEAVTEENLKTTPRSLILAQIWFWWEAPAHQARAWGHNGRWLVGGGGGNWIYSACGQNINNCGHKAMCTGWKRCPW